MAPRSNAKQSAALDPALPQKKRARRRVVGALAVCVAAAIVLPVVLDSEPRQIRDDVQVQIPSRDTPISEPLPGAARDADRSLRAPDAKPDAVADAAGKVEPSDGDRAAAQPESAGGTGGAVRDEARPDPVRRLARPRSPAHRPKPDRRLRSPRRPRSRKPTRRPTRRPTRSPRRRPTRSPRRRPTRRAMRGRRRKPRPRSTRSSPRRATPRPAPRRRPTCCRSARSRARRGPPTRPSARARRG